MASSVDKNKDNWPVVCTLCHSSLTSKSAPRHLRKKHGFENTGIIENKLGHLFTIRSCELKESKRISNREYQLRVDLLEEIIEEATSAVNNIITLHQKKGLD